MHLFPQVIDTQNHNPPTCCNLVTSCIFSVNIFPRELAKCVFADWIWNLFIFIIYFCLQQLINLGSWLPRSCIKSSHCGSSTGGGGEALPPGGCVSTRPTLATIDRKHWFISCLREQVVEPFLILSFFFSLLLSRSSGVCGLKYELLFLIRGRIFLPPRLHLNPTLSFKTRGDAWGAFFFFRILIY